VFFWFCLIVSGSAVFYRDSCLWRTQLAQLSEAVETFSMQDHSPQRLTQDRTKLLQCFLCAYKPHIIVFSR